MELAFALVPQLQYKSIETWTMLEKSIKSLSKGALQSAHRKLKIPVNVGVRKPQGDALFAALQQKLGAP